MMRVVVVKVVRMCIKGAQNRCWFRSLTHTLKTTKSRYVIAGISSYPAYTSTDYCLKEKCMRF